MTTDPRRRRPAVAAKVLVAGLASAATFGLTAAMAVTSAPDVPALPSTSVAVAPGVVGRRADPGSPAQPAPRAAERAPVRSRTRGS
jgi:hypothetical protein